MRWKNYSYPLAVLCISLLFQAAALVFLYPSAYVSAPAVFDKPYQAFLLLCVSCAVSCVLIIRNPAVRTAVIFIKICVFLFICQAIGSADSVYLFYFASVLTDAVMFVPAPAGAAVSVLVCSLAFIVLQPHQVDGMAVKALDSADAAALLALAAVITAGGSLIRTLWRRCRKLLSETARLENVIRRVSNTNLAYQAYALGTEKKAVKKERQRLSREIHDIIGYTMTNVLMLIQAARHCRDEEKKGQLLDKALVHLSESVDEARLALRRLRDGEIQSKHGLNLFVQLTRTFSAITGIEVSVDFGNMPQLFDTSAEKVIFRMIQEGMTNSFRHGRASKIDIGFQYGENGIMVRIHDNGAGSGFMGERVKEGIGIRGMRERIKLLNGSFSAGFVADGFLVQAVIPIDGRHEEFY